MMQGSRKFVKNAVANIVTGGSAAILAVVLPYYFVRCFRPAEFSLWVLVLQLAAYVNFFGCAVQTAIGRYVALALGRGNQQEAEDAISAGQQVLAVLGLVAIVAILIVSHLLPVLFPKVAPEMVATARAMLLWIGSAFALALPFLAYLGAFVGLQKNEIPAGISLVSKAVLALALVAVAAHTHDLKSVAETYFVVSLLGHLLQFVVFKRVCRGWKVRLLPRNPALRKQLIFYCLSMSVWSIGTLLVTGLDTTIVGIFDFKSVAAYGISAGLIALFLGFFRAVMAPLIQVFTKLHAGGDLQPLFRLLEFTSFVASTLLLCVACWLVLLAPALFRIWVGQQVAAASVPIFAVLAFATAIRNSPSPYANYLLAVGLQHKVYLGPLVEGVLNVIFSIAAAMAFGAIGVAWGTVAGGIVAVAIHYFYNLSRTTPREFSPRAYFVSNIAAPVLATSPMLIVLILALHHGAPLGTSVPGMAVATLPCVLVAWRKYQRVVHSSKACRASARKLNLVEAR